MQCFFSTCCFMSTGSISGPLASKVASLPTMLPRPSNLATDQATAAKQPHHRPSFRGQAALPPTKLPRPSSLATDQATAAKQPRQRPSYRGQAASPPTKLPRPSSLATDQATASGKMFNIIGQPSCECQSTFGLSYNFLASMFICL